MASKRIVSPTGSYFMDVPLACHEEFDGRVASYWLAESDVLLQTSSYSRARGMQVSANERLEARIAREGFVNVIRAAISVSACPDVAAAWGVDHSGLRWLFVYAVWPDLTVLATISGHPDDIEINGVWALEAVSSLRRTA